MNINKKILLASVMITPFFILGVAAAQEHAETEATDEATAQTDQERITGNEGLTLQERLQKRKDNLRTRLDTAKRLRIQTQCKAAQGHISRLKQALGKVETSRDSRYSNLVERLKTLADNLKSHDIDTTEFEQQIVELEVKIGTFQTGLAKYQEAIDDLADMDCAADPEGFQASLEEGRIFRAQAVDDGQAIRSYLRDTIKKTLQTIRGELASRQEGNN